MIKKQLLFALRRLGRHKLTTAINILGLTFGILSCVVIYLYVAFEFSYDKFHADADRIYRLVPPRNNGSDIQSNDAAMSGPLGPALRHEATGFSAVTTLFTDDTRVLIPRAGQPARVIPAISGDQTYHITFADTDYLKIFHYQWLAGDPATALLKPFSVVLTESEAKRYFQGGTPEDWMGRSVVYEDSLTVSVTGIVKDWEQHTDFGFKDLISYSTLERSFLNTNIQNWSMSGSNINIYVKLAPGTTTAQAEEQFTAFFKRHRMKTSLLLQPLADIHFNAAYGDTYGRRAHKPTLFALAGIALFILVIAAINFINLSTAQSILRAKEVGIRKVMGSSVGGIVRQFLIETGIIVVAAMAVALLLANPVIKVLHGFIPEGVRLHAADPHTWLFIGTTVFVTCLIAGWYPGRALSSFLPATSLKGQGVRQLNAKSYLRKGLIVFQFTVSLLFIIGTMMVGRQIHYMLNTDLGFNKDAIVTIDIPWGQPNNRKDVLATEIRHLAGVRQVSLNTADPESLNHMLLGIALEYKGASDVTILPGGDDIDTGYISLYGMTLVAGRNFYLSDVARPGYRAYILNESAARALGFHRPADALGRQLIGVRGSATIIGIVKDFHSDDLHQKIRPFVFTSDAGAGAQLSVKLSSTGLSAAEVKTLMTNMESVFKKLYPGALFQSRFFDESLEQLYTQERQTSQILNIAMGIAIFISCMGLFGLAAFNANQRTREIGIRKVLGAGVPQLVTLLSREFVLLVGLSTVIAAPLAGWGAHQWLQNFAYRTSMPWWIFVLAGVAATVIALLTVSLQTIRAARANPVKSLRVE
ncbi:ABC transporter permease [Dinghuibacter silviterrae]|uniref:ABC-type antimicrobial peptide transport system permease subunit n=1 Tax=Dinghuibacter silviterrae TaxID=1539049 RepID=A0A4R8DUT6_9BACT|nr:ABC transporter permease [Dinghuibacter silviterrae]TDX02162.1 ABC-type antimicrobial peptide transport system permease subunit [Dinghuibacter silviterrae]